MTFLRSKLVPAIWGGLIGVSLFGKDKTPRVENDNDDDDAIVVEKFDF